MCTNTATVNNNCDCYMDDLIECFEDFIKKSLILITVGLGAVVFTLLYLLKLVTERTQLLALQTTRLNLSAAPNIAANAANIVQNEEVSSLKKHDSPYDAEPPNCQDSKLLLIPNQNDSTLRSNVPQLLSKTNIDETLSRNISSSSRITNQCRPAGSLHICSETNIKACDSTQGAVCIPKHHLSAPRCCAKYNIASRRSCCSMCCDDDDKR